MKEHTVIVVMANCTFGTGAAYATDTLLAQRAFYKQDLGWVSISEFSSILLSHHVEFSDMFREYIELLFPFFSWNILKSNFPTQSTQR